MNSILCRLAVVVLISLTASAVWAQGKYPSKPILVIAAEPAGGPNDVENRRILPKVSSLIGQQFLIDYRPGAGMTIGSRFVAKAPPDGYTLLLTTSTFTVFPAFYKDLPFDTIKDFTPISLASQKTTLLLASPSFPAKTFKDYIAYAKANPEKINLGTSGPGTISHLAGAWMHSATKTAATYVHYKATVTKMADLMASRIDVAPIALAGGVPLIKAGKARALAIMSTERSKLMPDVPTVAEYIPGYNYASWWGYTAPAGTPPAIIRTLRDAIAKSVKSPEVAGFLEGRGSTPVGNTPEEFAQFIAQQTAQWKKVVDENNIRLEVDGK